MRIIEIISDTNIGGAGVLLINRLRHTDKKKYETCVLLPKGSMLAPRLDGIGIKYVEVDCRGDRSFDIGAVRKYIKLFKEICPDIINAHGCLSARIAAKLCRVPVKICTRHCVYPVSKKYKFFKPVLGALNSWISDCFVAVAHSARDNLVALGVSDRKIQVIINGAEPLRKLGEQEKHRFRQELNISESACVLVMCARLEACKGHDWFIDTVKMLKDDGMDFSVLFLGDGSRRELLEEKSREMKVDDKIIFMGFIQDISPFMNIANININCSVGTETSSLALSEGMSIGLPAAVSDYGGNPYMIKHGENGLICPCRDSRAMADNIEMLMRDSEMYSGMSVAAKKRFDDELNAEAMTKKTNLLYDRLFSAATEQKRS